MPDEVVISYYNYNDVKFDNVSEKDKITLKKNSMNNYGSFLQF